MPLINDAHHSCAVHVVALLSGGINFEEPKTDGSGATLLLVACQEGHIEVVSVLLDAGAAVDKAKSDAAVPRLPRGHHRGGHRAAVRGRGYG